MTIGGTEPDVRKTLHVILKRLCKKHPVAVVIGVEGVPVLTFNLELSATTVEKTIEMFVTQTNMRAAVQTGTEHIWNGATSRHIERLQNRKYSRLNGPVLVFDPVIYRLFSVWNVAWTPVVEPEHIKSCVTALQTTDTTIDVGTTPLCTLQQLYELNSFVVARTARSMSGGWKKI